MPKLTLTFDNGPTPEVTPRVLDLLGERGMKAHFYVLGKFLVDEVGRDLVGRAVREGHRVGNHSFTHETPLGDDPRSDAVDLEIVRTATLLDPLVPGDRLFRPFGGGGKIGTHLLSQAAADHLVAGAYSCVLWNSVPRDWEDQAGWAARALEDCTRRNHTVLVLHDVPNASGEKLGWFLERVQSSGIEVVLDVPSSLTPILSGNILGDLRSIVAS